MDFARFLPLSNRPADDESAVTSDRRNATADVVDEAARLTALAGPQRADQLAAEFARAARLADAGAAEFGAADLPELATAVRSGSRRRTSALVHAVRALLVLADELNDVPRVADLTLGVVALYMATSAPLERRAVVAGHAIRATDADWQFGRGPVLEGTAMAIVRFLVGLSDVPPQPAKREG
jgi:predicted amidohydrolase